MDINYKYEHFTSKELKPTGWLKKQLRVQADGLSGNLDKIWPDVRDSRWIGGDKEGWERVPYWLDGFIPLAYLLDDEDLKARAKKYIDAIIEHQNPDGWICPCKPEERVNYDTWATILICKVLVLYYECSGDERAFNAAEAALLQFKDHLRDTSLIRWGHARWYEALIPIYAIYKRKPALWLERLALTISIEGMDYNKLFDHWQDQGARPEWTYQTHIVNLMMALKSDALFTSAFGGNTNAFAHRMWNMMEKYHGSPVGYINGDECLAGRSAIHGTELCDIVEAMYSFEILYEITGDTYWMDKAETFAFNFLPATMSEDMWTHQYLQMTNQISCTPLQSPFFYTSGLVSHCFGLEPNFGCCTANFSQGWPKFALSAFYRSQKGVHAALPIPSVLEFERNGVKINIEVETDYPFGDTVKYRIKTSEPTKFKFSIRVPNCASATIDGVDVEPREKIAFENRTWNDDIIEMKLTQKLEFVPWDYEMYTLKRGNLIFAAPIADERKTVEYTRDGVERKFPYCDYEISPKEEWSLAYTDSDLGLCFDEIGDRPFSAEKPPISVDTELAAINWGTEYGQPTICRESPYERTPLFYLKKKLIPYGATTLRMTTMPKVKK